MTGVTSSNRFQFDPPPKVMPGRGRKAVQVPKWVANTEQQQTLNGDKDLPPPPPPPPPPAPPVKEIPNPEGTGDNDELKAKCKHLFTYLTLTDVPEPRLEGALRCLKADVEAKIQAKKLDKDAVHRISLPKHYMKKDLFPSQKA